MNEINFKISSAEWPPYFPGINLVIWKCPRIIGYTRYQAISKYRLVKRCFCTKNQKIYILPIWLLIMINQIVNNVNNALKQLHHMNLIFYIWRKSVTFKPRQDKTRHDKAWQGMARQGQARPDEARRGGAQTRRCPLVLKILYISTSEVIPYQ